MTQILYFYAGSNGFPNGFPLFKPLEQEQRPGQIIYSVKKMMIQLRHMNTLTYININNLI